MNVSRSLWMLKRALEPCCRAHEAQWLLCHALQIDAAQLPLLLNEPVSEVANERLESYIKRVQAGEPLQYILGCWEFYGRTFLTDARALIPRPETELLVREALLKMDDTGRFADAGCGSGCIGLTLALERPGWEGTLMDISADALALAEENRNLLGVGCSMLEADMNRPLPGRPYDLIVSNPPYISEEQLDLMDPWVIAYEPHQALFAPHDGMAFYEALAQRAQDSLKNGGWLMAECGIGQAEEIQSLWAPLCDTLYCRKDENTINRVIAGRKKIYAS